jgi:hypothetical protein
MAEEPRPDTSMLEVAAALLASSVIGAPLVIASAVQAVMFSLAMPAVTSSGLVLSQPALGAFVLAFAGAVIAVALVFSRLRARAESRAVLRVPYMVLALQIAFAVIAIALAALTPVIVLV